MRAAGSELRDAGCLILVVAAGHSLTRCLRFSKAAGYFFSFSKVREAEFIQYLSPVGLGPSSKTCPR